MRRSCACWALVAGFAWLACHAGGCAGDPTLGYSSRSTFATNVRTIAVPVFDNTTYTYRIEALLTEALIKEIEQTTPWRVVDPARADTVLTGAIVGADLRPTAIRRGVGYVQEQAVQLTVNFDWRDNRTGRPLVRRRNFSASEVFAPSRPVRERVEVAQYAVVEQLAEDIVAQLRSAW